MNIKEVIEEIRKAECNAEDIQQKSAQDVSVVNKDIGEQIAKLQSDSSDINKNAKTLATETKVEPVKVDKATMTKANAFVMKSFNARWAE